MAFDSHVNFGYGEVQSPPTPANAGTSLTLVTGFGAIMPTPPFNAVVWPAALQATTTNAEIVRVTAVAGDALTIARQQEGSTARSIVAGDQFSAAITKKTLTDVEGAAASALQSANNLSDLANATTALANLGGAAALAQSSLLTVTNSPVTGAVGDEYLFDMSQGSCVLGLPSTPADRSQIGAKIVASTVTTTLSSTLSTLAPITSLTVNAIRAAIPSGATVSLVATAAPQNFQTFTLSAPATAGATGLSVNSETPTYNFPASTTTVTYAPQGNTLTVNTGGSDVFDFPGSGLTSGTLTLASQAKLWQYNHTAGTWTAILGDNSVSQLQAQFAGVGITSVNSGASTCLITVPAGGAAYSVTLTGSSTFAFAGATANSECNIDLLLTQDNTGGRTITWPSSISWLPGAAPTLPTGPGTAMLVSLVSLNGGSSWFGYYNSGQGAPPAALTTEFGATALVPAGTAKGHTQYSLYLAEFYVPGAATITGFRCYNTNNNLGNILISLYSATGTRLAQSANTAQSGTTVFQSIPFTAPYAAVAGRYFAGYQFDTSSGTSNTYDSVMAGLSGIQAQGSQAAPSSITPPSTTSASNYVPFITTY